MALTQTQVSQLYVSIFNRASEGNGNTYWQTNGADLASVATEMLATTDAATYFGSNLDTNQDFVEWIYLNTLNKTTADDAAGIAYWVAELDSGVSRGQMVANLVTAVNDYATSTDAATLAAYNQFTNRVTVSNYMADTVAAAPSDYATSTSFSSGLTVTSDAATVNTAKTAVNDIANPGQTFSLTNSAEGDDFIGTSGNDTFEASSVTRLQDQDVLDGAGGNDVLNAKVFSTTAHDATIIDIETINYTMYGNTTVNGALISGTDAINLVGGYTFTIADAQAGIEYSIQSDDAALTVDTNTVTDSTTNAITVNVQDDLGTLTLGDQADVDFETITLNVTGAGSATLTEAGTADFTDVTTEKIVVTGSGDFDLTMDDEEIGSSTATVATADAVEIDASAHTGTFTLNIGAIGTPGTDDIDFFNAVSLSGVDKIKFGTNSGNTGTTTIEKVASGTTLVVTSTEHASTDDITVTERATATNDTLTLEINHATAGTSITLDDITVDGFETFTLTSTGTDSATATVANTVADIKGTSSDTNLVLAGDKALTVSTGIEATWTNIDVTNTAGVDVIVAAGGALNFLGGAGNDRLELDTVADITSADVLNGGDGTADTLAISAVMATDFTAAQRAVISNFEVLEYKETLTTGGNVTIDLTELTGINSLTLNGAVTTADAKQLTVKADTNATLKFTAAVADTNSTTAANLIVNVTNAASAGTNDNVNVVLDEAGGNLAHSGLTIDNVENITINVKGDSNNTGAASSHAWTVADIDGAQLQNIVIASTNTDLDANGDVEASDNLVITTVESTLLTSVDASAFTGTLTITGLAGKYSALGATITGGSGVDNITGGTGADLITGNDGADVLIGGTGNDQIDGGAGADNIEGGAGADTLTGGTGDNIFEINATESTEASMDQITDFTAGAADADFDTIELGSGVENVGTNDSLDLLQVHANITSANAVDVKAATTDTDTSVTAYITNGMITLAGTEAANVNTLAEWIDVAEILLHDNEAAIGTDALDAIEIVVGFEFNGNTYLVSALDGHGGADIATNDVIKLTGLVGITGISETESSGVIHIAQIA